MYVSKKLMYMQLCICVELDLEPQLQHHLQFGG